MRRIIFTILGLLTVAAITPAMASARVVVKEPTAFSSNGPVISGWSWLRTKNATASWTFSATGVQGARAGSVYLLLSPLVTNGTSGGGGYSRSIQIVIRHVTARPSSVTPVTKTVSLYNPFRPITPENTNGIGYQTYGYTSVPTSTWRGADSITVTVQWKSGYHVAVKKGAVQLSYRIP